MLVMDQRYEYFEMYNYTNSQFIGNLFIYPEKIAWGMFPYMCMINQIYLIYDLNRNIRRVCTWYILSKK